MRSLVFLNRFYWPEKPATGQLLTDLAELLAAKGHRVTVVTSRDQSLPKLEEHRGVRIQRLESLRWQSSGRLAKAAAWAGFAIAALWWLGRRLQPGDTLVLLTDPPLLCLLAGPIARAKGARVIHWTQDIYPELPMRLGGMRWLSPLCRLRNREWRQSAACIALGTDMRDFILRAGLPAGHIRVIPNWAPQGLTPAVPELIAHRREVWGLNGKFVVAYSGNLGRVHELEVIIALAAELRENVGLIFLFIGEGAQLGRLRSLVETLRLTNVRFLPPQPRDDLAVSLGVADAHFVTLRPGCEALVFPSKFYGILAVGKPVLYIGPPQTEIARHIREARLGAAFDREDASAMAAEIKRWQQDPELVARMSHNAASALPQQGGLASAATLWQELLAAPAEPTSIQAS